VPPSPAADPYLRLLRPLIFSGLKLDPERMHLTALGTLAWLGRPSTPAPVQRWLRHQFCLSDPRLAQTCLGGLSFANPLGLAAGFDKDGEAARVWPYFGFGYTELGTVTQHGQPGNPQPRLFRLVPDEAVLNRMGFNNHGAAALAKRLSTDLGTDRGNSFPIPVGINLGKSKVTPLEEAAADYCYSFRQLEGLGDYFVVNVSSPNTPGLRSLQAAAQLDPILAALQAANTRAKPLLVKIAPDLAWEDIRAVLTLAQKHRLAGIVATNTTIARDGLTTTVLPRTGNPITAEAGGISGAPLRQRSTEVIRFIWQETQGQLPIIGVGGIFTAADAWEKITAGACLLQVYTGWVYEGPWMVRRIMEGLLERLEAHGLPSIGAAVGLAHGEHRGSA